MATAFQANAFQNNAFQIDGTPPTPPTPDTSNPTGGGGVRGRQYVERLSKRQEWLERLRLGIVFEELENADAAAATAARAEARIAATKQDGDERTAAQQTAEAAREAYVAVYREFMAADAIAEQYRADVEQHRRRIRVAAATLLLLH